MCLAWRVTNANKDLILAPSERRPSSYHALCKCCLFQNERQLATCKSVQNGWWYNGLVHKDEAVQQKDQAFLTEIRGVTIYS